MTNKLIKRKEYIAILACSIIFFMLLWMVESGTASIIDEPIRSFIISCRNDVLTPLMKGITNLGGAKIVTVICVLLLIFKKTRVTYGVPLSIGAIIVPYINREIKALVLRPRPDQATFLIEQGGWSFPSGHAITTMFFYGMFIYLIRKNMTNRKAANILTAILAIPMIFGGISRIYLGVHYPTDVLAGWCLGLLAILVMAEIIKMLERRKNK